MIDGAISSQAFWKFDFLKVEKRFSWKYKIHFFSYLSQNRSIYIDVFSF